MSVAVVNGKSGDQVIDQTAEAPDVAVFTDVALRHIRTHLHAYNSHTAPRALQVSFNVKHISILSTRGHPNKFAKASCSTSCRSQFFNQRIVNVWSSLPRIVDFTSLTSFKRTINDVDYSDFLKVFSF